MKSLSGLVPVLAIFLSLDSVRARPQANGQPISGVGIVEKVERVNLHEKVNSSGSNNRVYLDVLSVRGTTEDSREALLETSPPQIVADLKISSALTTSAVNSTNDETSRTAVTKPTPIGESLKTVTKQLLHSPSATDMTVTDVRTPPKIKNQLLSHEMIALGKGEAVPVIMEEEHHNYEKLSSPQSHTSQSHVGIGTYSKRPIEDSTSQSGLSTWILLNNDNVHGLHSSTQNTATDEASLKMTNKVENMKTSPATFPENKVAQKKKQRPTTTTPSYSSTEALHGNTKQTEVHTSGPKKSEKKPMINTSIKTSPSTTPYIELYTERLDEIVAEIDPATGEKKPLITLQDSKFKNKTPVIVGRIPQKDKIEASTVSAPTSRTPTRIVSPSEPVTKAVNDNITRFGTPVVTFPHVPPRVRPSAQVKEDEKIQQTKLQLQKQQQQKLQTQYQQKLQQQKIQQQLQEQNTKPISTTMPPLFSPTTAAMTTPKSEAVSAPPATNVTQTTVANATATPSEAPTVTATKKTKRPGQKRKKNKTRRKRPTKTSTKNDLESKVSEQDNNPAAKIPGIQNKPLSTRIYNYLAREVVPNVGVGLVGLMLTAGLAGLLLYPFGGGIAARRTEKFSGNAPDGHNYYYNEYSTTGDMDHGQAEEQVFGQVLAGMSHDGLQYSNSYSRERPNSNNNYYPANNKYKPTRYETVDDYAQAGMAGFKEDMTQESKYSTLGDVNKDYNADMNPKYPAVSSINAQNSDPYAITDTEADTNVNKYVDPTSSSDVKDQKFTAVAGSTADVKANTKYSSSIDSTYNTYSGQVGHGTVYNDEVGYGDNPDSEHKNHRVDYQTQEENVSMEKIKPSDASDEIITAEDNKSVSLTQSASKEEQPTYSALEGIPKRINYNYGYEKTNPSDETYSESFVPMNVNDQDSFNHRYSLQVEHGPRSLKLEDVTVEQKPKARRRRNVPRPRVGKSNKELENEIDGVLPEEAGNSPVKKADTTSSGPSSSAPVTVKNGSTTDSQKNAVKSTTNSAVTDGSESAGDSLHEEDELSDSADKVEFIPSEKPTEDFTKPTSFSFLDILKKVAEFKINLGLNILKTTSETLSRYLGTIQSKMVTAMRHINQLDKELRKGAEKFASHVKDPEDDEKFTSDKKETHKDGSEQADDPSGKPTTSQAATASNLNLNDDISHIDMSIDSDFSSSNNNFDQSAVKTKASTSQPSRNVIKDDVQNGHSDCNGKENCSSSGEISEQTLPPHSIRRRDLSNEPATKKRQNVKKYRPLKKT